MKKFILFFTLFLSPNQAFANPVLLIKTISQQNFANDKNVFNLQKQKGKVALVVFWANWCVVCRAEIIELDNLYKKYHSQGLEIIGLNVDGVIKNAQNLSYPIAIFDNALENNFDNPKTLPMIYVINKDGSTHSQLYLPEQIDLNNIEKIIKSLLTSKP